MHQRCYGYVSEHQKPYPTQQKLSIRTPCISTRAQYQAKDSGLCRHLPYR